MDKRLLKVTMISIRRRWRGVLRTFVAALLAVFFVTGILIFEENMFEWQVASNKDRFGDWFVMEANTSKQSENLMNHPLLSEYAEAFCAVRLCDEDFDYLNCYVGYMSPEFLEIGCIKPVQGRMPTADNEVAMDYKTLAKLGITSPKVGQEVTLRYYEKNSEYDEKNKRTEELVLVGILENYTNVWNGGRNLPGTLVTKQKYEAYGYEGLNAYIYKLTESERHGNHQAIYEEIAAETKINLRYNSYVYDFKAWGTETVYDYMYVLVMVIGIAALTYQLLVYKNSRVRTYDLMRRLGGTKVQVAWTAFVENVLMLLPSGVLGILLAALVGKLLCAVIEYQMGIGFYYINLEILLKGLLAVLIAVVVEEVAGRIVNVRAIASRKTVRTGASKTAEAYTCHKRRRRLTVNNVWWVISNRFTCANKESQNISIRLFSLMVCVVIVLCGCQIYNAQVKYDANKDNVDFMGVAYIDKDYTMKVPFYAVIGIGEDEEVNHVNAFYGGKAEITDIEIQPTDEQIEQLVMRPGGSMAFGHTTHKLDEKRMLLQMHMPISNGRFYRVPDANITAGFTQDTIETIKNVAGVREVSFSTFESQRAWTWEGMSFDKLGYKLLMQEKSATVASPSEYSGRYLFATEYVSPTEELYARLSKYMAPDMVDYEAFARGEQVLVLQDTNPYGAYDDTLKAGTTINYHYYELPFERYEFGNAKEKDINEIFAWDEALMDYTEGKLWEKEEWSPGQFSINILLDDYSEYTKYAKTALLKPCIQTKAAAVVRLTDEVKKEFEDLIVRYGYYTAIASSTLAENACDRQNSLLEELVKCVGIQQLPDSCKASVVYNQIDVRYNLQSSVCATDNILKTFCMENSIDYVSYAAVKEQYRTNLINAWLQYGITIIAVIVINMLICAVVARNRLEARKQRTELLLRLGAERKDVRKVFMIEAVREALWCMFTLPIILLIQCAIYRRNI